MGVVTGRAKDRRELRQHTQAHSSIRRPQTLNCCSSGLPRSAGWPPFLDIPVGPHRCSDRADSRRDADYELALLLRLPIELESLFPGRIALDSAFLISPVLMSHSRSFFHATLL
jgi:hypothetical protein